MLSAGIPPEFLGLLYRSRVKIDAYGVPENLFGPLDPNLPALLGRIVMLAALAESKVDALASSLSMQLQSSTAGRPFIDNLRTCKKHLSDVNDPTRKELATTTLTLLDDVEIAMRMRNTLVHRVWPIAGENRWGGWKAIPQSRRDPAAVEWTDWKDFTHEELEVEVARWVALLEALGHALASSTVLASQ